MRRILMSMALVAAFVGLLPGSGEAHGHWYGGPRWYGPPPGAYYRPPPPPMYYRPPVYLPPPPAYYPPPPVYYAPRPYYGPNVWMR